MIIIFCFVFPKELFGDEKKNNKNCDVKLLAQGCPSLPWESSQERQ